MPLAGLLNYAIGAGGRYIAAVAAIVLTLGASNAYINGAAAMAGQLSRTPAGSRASGPRLRLLAAITGAGLVLITLYGLRIVGTAALVAVPTTPILAVYVAAMLAALRVLSGAARLAALPATIAVIVVLGFCGWALTVPIAIALAASLRPRFSRVSARPDEQIECMAPAIFGTRDTCVPRYDEVLIHSDAHR